MPLLYGDSDADILVGWYRLLDPPADHEDETAGYLRALRKAADGDVTTMLELGAGAGHNAVHLKEQLTLTLSDRSAPMLALSRALNPECEHVEGDMRTLRLDRTFDLVLIHDAICYMTSKDDLRRALETAFVHLRPGGAALFAPDCVRETLVDETSLEGSDEADGSRSLRCLMWTWDPSPADDTYVVDFAFLLRDSSGVRSVHDRHIEGVFSRETWKSLVAEVGFELVQHAIAVPEEVGREEELFVCRRPRMA